MAYKITEKQEDAVFRIWYEVRGGHTHYSLFAAPNSNATFAKCGDFVTDNKQFIALTLAMQRVEFNERRNHVDLRDPDPSRKGIFRAHNCWKCNSGAQPCVSGNSYQCEYPHARND